jgi:glucan phosphoethanolaminetransferase (alkaline phosphatase superfamily)
VIARLTPEQAASWADVILVVHVAIVLFVVGMLPLILLGGRLGWDWVRRRWLRVLHLAAILVVAAQAWVGALCSLTVWEQDLRRHAGQVAYDASFIEYWLSRLLYVEAPWPVFVAAYTLFALMVLAAWWWVPPRGRRR